MFKTLLNTGALAAVVATALAAAPASAQDYNSRAGYYEGESGQNQYEDDDRNAQYDRQDEEYRRYQNSRRQQRSRQYYTARQDAYVRQRHHQDQHCSAGTAGAIIGGVLGGLLGRELGRGGYYNEPSTTGLILGAGGGALAGRAIERNRKCR